MRLKEIRESKGISQRQAAIGLNLSPTVYNRYENGLREPPNIVLLAMADFFGVSVDDLLGRDTQALNLTDPYRAKTIEARIVSGGMDQLPMEDRERILNMLRAMYNDKPELFKDGGHNDS